MKILPRRRVALLGTAAALTIAVPLLACEGTVGTEAAAPSSTSSELALIGDVMQRVETSYVEPVNSQKFVTDALKGALSGLDPHSDYMDEKEYRRMRSDTRGEFGGLGIELTMEDGIPKVISPIDDTPAARAGVRAGDLIVKIAGQPTDNMNLGEVVEKLRGPSGSKIGVTLLRGHGAPFNLELTRAVIHVVSVKSALHGRTGYARISSFTEQTQDELTAAIDHMKRQAGGHLAGFVLDLRNDPGGLLDAAVDVAGDFLDGGTVVSTRGRQSDDDERFTAPTNGDRLPGVPVVVLINGASASASEIVAGALQDAHRATVMGTGSFGKGSVQTIIPLHGRGALRLTTARYYTPSGRSIQDHGITPDIVVGLSKSAELSKGIVVREADLRGALKNTGALDATKRAKLPAAGHSAAATTEEPPIDPMIIGTSKDEQLSAALRYLAGHTARSHAAQRG